MREFRAFTVTRDDDEVRTAVERLPAAALPAGDVLVRVEWSAVNFKDAMVTQPKNRVARCSPLVPGVDLAGTVEESATPAFTAGQPVIVHGYDLGVAHFGGFAELARVPGDWVVPLPADLTARQAMVIGTAGFTAALSLAHLERNGLVPGHGPVLVTGASGGVGSMAVARLAAAGYEVVASSGKADQADYLRGLGATEVIGRHDLNPDATRVLGPERWAGAIDCVGGTTLTQVLRTLRYGAAVAASGLTGGHEVATTVYPFIVRNVALLGIDTVATPIAERRAVWATMAGAFAPELLEQISGDEIGLHELDRTLADVLAARTTGRILVRPDRIDD